MDEYLEATGYDWIEYLNDEKEDVVHAIFEILKAPNDSSVKLAIDTLDSFYKKLKEDAESDPNIEEEKILNIPCLKILTNIIQASINEKKNSK